MVRPYGRDMTFGGRELSIAPFSQNDDDEIESVPHNPLAALFSSWIFFRILCISRLEVMHDTDAYTGFLNLPWTCRLWAYIPPTWAVILLVFNKAPKRSTVFPSLLGQKGLRSPVQKGSSFLEKRIGNLHLIFLIYFSLLKPWTCCFLCTGEFHRLGWCVKFCSFPTCLRAKIGNFLALLIWVPWTAASRLNQRLGREFSREYPAWTSVPYAIPGVKPDSQ